MIFSIVAEGMPFLSWNLVKVYDGWAAQLSTAASIRPAKTCSFLIVVTRFEQK